MSSTDAFLDQLRGHQPSDETEAGHLLAIVNLLTTSSSAFSRRQFIPGHVTASCYIIDDGGRMLLHHHRRLARWLQMGGHVEPGELPHDAALREGVEESGLDDLELIGGILDVDVHAIPAGRGEPPHDHFDVRYLARTASPERISIDRAESDELAWVPLEQAGELMRGPESLRVIAKIERLLRGRSSP